MENSGDNPHRSVLCDSVETTACKLPVFKQWFTGKLFAFSHLDGPNDTATSLVVRSVPNGLEVRIPGECQISFAFSGVSTVVFGSDFFIIKYQDARMLHGVLLDAHHMLLEGSAKVEACSAAILTRSHDQRILLGSATHFNPDLIEADVAQAITKRSCWISEQFVVIQQPEFSTNTREALYLAISQMKGQVCSPEGEIRHAWTTPDRWPHRWMWLWDSVFHAIGMRHLDVALAKSAIDAVFDLQRSDGFIAHMLLPSRFSEYTQPPVLALGVKLVLEKSNDLTWLHQVYPKLCAYVKWDLAHRDLDGDGLVEWCIGESPTCRSSESGMDNSPRFDSAIPLDAPDFNAFLAHECEILAEFAQTLGLNDEAEAWQAHHAHLCSLINRYLWCAETSLYHDRDPATNQLTPVMASSGFLPLLCGAPSQEQALLLAAHLENPQTFGTSFPVPSIAANDTDHYLKDMWRGPTWININWLIARGFKRYGLTGVAEKLRQQTLTELESGCQHYGTFFEYFDDRQECPPPKLLRKLKNIPGEHPHQAIHDFGWSATLYVDWLLEDS